MENFAEAHGIRPRLIRGTMELNRIVETRTETSTLIIHPGRSALLEQFLENIEMEADAVNRLTIIELPSGMILKWVSDPVQGGLRCSFPPGSMWTESQIKFWPCAEPLNEFGYLYVALYIAGNYARYFPDRWMVDVEESSPLALAIEQLISVAVQRMPLLTLSELMRIYQVPRA